MKLTLTIQMDNAAFDDGNDGHSHAAEIMRDAAKHVERGGIERIFTDANGNRVGQFKITGKRSVD